MDAVILVHQLVDWQLQVDADIDILLTACSMSCNTYQLQNQMKSRRYNHNMSCICNCVLCMEIRALVQFVCKYCSSHQLMMMHVVYMVMVIGDSVHVCTPVHHLAESNCKSVLSISIPHRNFFQRSIAFPRDLAVARPPIDANQCDACNHL